jgi:hypothetical protein
MKEICNIYWKEVSLCDRPFSLLYFEEVWNFFFIPKLSLTSTMRCFFFPWFCIHQTLSTQPLCPDLWFKHGCLSCVTATGTLHSIGSILNVISTCICIWKAPTVKHHNVTEKWILSQWRLRIIMRWDTFVHPLKMWEGGREVIEGWCEVFVRVSCFGKGGCVTLENYMEIDFRDTWLEILKACNFFAGSIFEGELEGICFFYRTADTNRDFVLGVNLKV